MAELTAEMQREVSPSGFTVTQGRAKLVDDIPGLIKMLVTCMAGLLTLAACLFLVALHVVNETLARYPTLTLEQDQRLYAYWATFVVMTLLMFGVAVAVTVGLMWPKTFSLSTALSAPSPVQPTIQKPEDVLLIGSTSRLIAFVGLLGILCLAVGVGYSVIFELIYKDKPPPLTQVCYFLVSMAALFAPYLANQLKEGLKSGKPSQPSGGAVKPQPSE